MDYARAHARIYRVLITLQLPYGEPHKPYDQTHGAYDEAHAPQTPATARNRLQAQLLSKPGRTSTQLLYGMVYGLGKPKPRPLQPGT